MDGVAIWLKGEAPSCETGVGFSEFVVPLQGVVISLNNERSPKQRHPESVFIAKHSSTAE